MPTETIGSKSTNWTDALNFPINFYLVIRNAL